MNIGAFVPSECVSTELVNNRDCIQIKNGGDIMSFSEDNDILMDKPSIHS